MNENPYQSPSVSAVKEQTPAEKIAQHERKITRRFIYAGLILGIAAFSYEGCNMLKEYEHKRKFQQREEQNKKDMEEFLERAHPEITIEEIADKFQEIDRKNTRELFSKK